MLTATVSGSFHRHMDDIVRSVTELVELGVAVLSPADPRVVHRMGDFLFVASDRVRSVRLVEDRHLQSIRASTFLWLVCPDGYVGQSASMEIGYAVASNIPIFSASNPSDLTLQQYVRQVPDLRTAVEAAKSAAFRSPQRLRYFLIDPHASIDEAHQLLDEMQKAFEKAPAEINDEMQRQIYRKRDALADLLLIDRTTRNSALR